MKKLIDTEFFMDAIILRCAHCHEYNTHQEEVVVAFRDTEDGPGTVIRIAPVVGHPRGAGRVAGDVSGQRPTDEEFSSLKTRVTRRSADDVLWEGRRDEVVIELSCETCQEITEFVVMQHKGYTQLRMRVKG